MLCVCKYCTLFNNILKTPAISVLCASYFLLPPLQFLPSPILHTNIECATATLCFSWGFVGRTSHTFCFLGRVYQFPRFAQSIGVKRRFSASILIFLLVIDLWCFSITSGVKQMQLAPL